MKPYLWFSSLGRDLSAIEVLRLHITIDTLLFLIVSACVSSSHQKISQHNTNYSNSLLFRAATSGYFGQVGWQVFWERLGFPYTFIVGP